MTQTRSGLSYETGKKRKFGETDLAKASDQVTQPKPKTPNIMTMLTPEMIKMSKEFPVHPISPKPEPLKPLSSGILIAISKLEAKLDTETRKEGPIAAADDAETVKN